MAPAVADVMNAMVPDHIGGYKLRLFLSKSHFTIPLCPFISPMAEIQASSSTGRPRKRGVESTGEASCAECRRSKQKVCHKLKLGFPLAKMHITVPVR